MRPFGHSSRAARLRSHSHAEPAHCRTSTATRPGSHKFCSPACPFPLVANPHPTEVNPAIGFLCTFERFGFVSGVSFPDEELVIARPAVSSMTGNSFNITADDFNHFPVGHVVVDAPWDQLQRSPGSQISSIRQCQGRPCWITEQLAVTYIGDIATFTAKLHDPFPLSC